MTEAEKSAKRTKEEVWDAYSSCFVHADVRPRLEQAVVEFLSRIDNELYNRLGEETITIVDCGTWASTVYGMHIPCLSHRKVKTIPVYIVLFRRNFDRQSHKAAVGEVAHEFAHLVLEIEQGIESLSSPAKEQEADDLARNWGFEEEISALRVALASP